MSILFKPLGVLLGLLRTEPKAFEMETTRVKLLFEISALSGRVVLGRLLGAPAPQSAVFTMGRGKGQECYMGEDPLCARQSSFSWNSSEQSLMPGLG